MLAGDGRRTEDNTNTPPWSRGKRAMTPVMRIGYSAGKEVGRLKSEDQRSRMEKGSVRWKGRHFRDEEETEDRSKLSSST